MTLALFSRSHQCFVIANFDQNFVTACYLLKQMMDLYCMCYDIMPVRKEEGKSYWKIPFCDDDATREK